MKILLFDYCNDARPIMKKMGYEHKQEIEISPIDYFMLINDFIENGLSIMIEKNSSEDIEYTLFLDKHGKRFRQR